jgi:hypothetical protein
MACGAIILYGWKMYAPRLSYDQKRQALESAEISKIRNKKQETNIQKDWLTGSSYEFRNWIVRYNSRGS